MNKLIVEQRADEIRKERGGKIFAFPYEIDNPHSKYVVTLYTGDQYITYPKLLDDISDAAAGVQRLLETLKRNGQDADFERVVRFVSYEAQVNAPDVRMRKLKKEGHLINQSAPRGFLKTGVDVKPFENGEEGYNFSAQGVIKMSYLTMVEDKTPNASKFMNDYYKLLAMKKYGKTAAGIKQEVYRMDKSEAISWIERTYKKYVNSDFEIFDIFNSLKA